jgi:hypothetical protein
MKYLRAIFALMMLFFIGYFIFNTVINKNVSGHELVTQDSIYYFKGLTGPAGRSVITPPHRSSWRKYSHGNNFGIGIFLTDTNCNWLGIAHAFKTFGIPFKFTTNVDTAILHDVVLVYPVVSAEKINPYALSRLAEFPKKGGTLIGDCVAGGLFPTFGITQANVSDKNFKIRMHDIYNPLLKEFTDPKEREISLGNTKESLETINTYNYFHPTGGSLMIYPNGCAFLTQNNFPGTGKAFAFGIDLGYFFLNCTNEKSDDAFRTYVNSYEPTMDVLVRIIRNIYLSSSNTAVYLGTVPDNKPVTVCITHDIDFLNSVYNAVKYAQMERARNITTTYFMQTKYIKDWNDVAFYVPEAVKCVLQIDSLHMEIASHSESHSQIYDHFPIGDGTEEYPSYHPVVTGPKTCRGGTVLGELRVSKFLLDHFLKKNDTIVSFRPGHLSVPRTMPQAMVATGFCYSSSFTANDLLTHLPFQMMYSLGYEAEVPVFEFPISIEDEGLPRLDKRLDSTLALARKLSKYGGLMCFLIHPNVIDYKFIYEQQLLDSLGNNAYYTSIRNFGDWWVARDAVRFYVTKSNKNYSLVIRAPKKIDDLTFHYPKIWTCTETGSNIRKDNETVNIKNPGQETIIHFTEK